MDDAKVTRLRLCIFLLLADLAFFVAYYLTVIEVENLFYFQMPVLVSIVACIGIVVSQLALLYLTHHPLQRFDNVMLQWVVMWLLCFQFYFLYLCLLVTIKPVFTSLDLEITVQPLVMLTIAFTLNKAFLDLEYTVCFSIIGIIGYTGAQVVITDIFNSFDSGGLIIFLFGGIYGTVNRLFKKAPFALTQQLRLSTVKCIAGTIFSMFCFPYMSIVTGVVYGLAPCNVMMCMVAAIIACIFTLLAANRRLSHQTVLYSAIASAVAISPLPGIIQNLAAPAAVGTIIGVLSALFSNKPHSFLKKMPSFVAELFIIPGLVGGLLAIIFIGCYSIPGYNRMENFPLQQYINETGKYCLLELAVLTLVIVLSALSALLNIFICYCIRCALKTDLLEPAFVTVENSQFLLVPTSNYNSQAEPPPEPQSDHQAEAEEPASNEAQLREEYQRQYQQQKNDGVDQRRPTEDIGVLLPNEQ